MRARSYVCRFTRHIVLLLIVLLTSSCVLTLTPTPEPVVLRFAYRQNTVAMKPLLEAFQAKYPWIQVETVEAERFGGQMESMIENAEVDIFREGGYAVAYAQRGLLQPLDDLQLDRWGSIRDDYFKGIWEALSISGQQWGVPAGLDLYVTYINTDQLQALNLKLPEPTWNLMDFLELATKINGPRGAANEEGGSLVSFCTTVESADPMIFIYLHGGTIVDSISNPTRATLDDPLTIEAVQWYSDLFNLHAVAPDPDMVRQQFARGGVYEAAIRGRCGVWLGWYSSRGGADTPFQWASGWKMLPLPRDRGDFSYGEIEGYYITKNCAHPNEAVTLLRFLADRQESSGPMLSPRRSMVNSESYKKMVGEDIAAIAQGFSDHVVLLPYSQNSALERIGQIMVGAFVQIVTQNLDAGPVLQEAQDKCREALQQAP